MSHDHLCELSKQPPWKRGECGCLARVMERDPIPDELLPIYPPYENCNVRPVQTSTTWQGAWADRRKAQSSWGGQAKPMNTT